MNSNPASGTKSTQWSNLAGKARKVLYYTIVLIIIVAGAYTYFKFFYTYSEGYRAGLLQKFSRKGTIFKTYEGEMILSSVRSTSDIAISSEKFFFSVIDKNLAGRIDTLQGENVIVHYIQKNSSLIWRGDSEYLVDSIRVKK
jgi:hypothetical protein